MRRYSYLFWGETYPHFFLGGLKLSRVQKWGVLTHIHLLLNMLFQFFEKGIFGIDN